MFLQPSYKGKYLLEYVCQQLNLTETDYFGLRYVDCNGQRVRTLYHENIFLTKDLDYLKTKSCKQLLYYAVMCPA